MNVRELFDGLYQGEDRYWWRDYAGYSTDPNDYLHSLLAQMTLRVIAGESPGRALDLGAGEGSDAIRLARLGYSVTAVDISEVGAGKIRNFAAQAGVTIEVDVADISTYEPHGKFDVVICNGVLHYIEGKGPVLQRMQDATEVGGINVISLWSNHTPVPKCHRSVPVFCDDEDGTVKKAYESWKPEILYFERGKREQSHSGMPGHSHSHIKLIARRLL